MDSDKLHLSHVRFGDYFSHCVFDTNIHAHACPELTSGLDLSYAHVHHHGSRCVISFHQGREVTAVDFTDVSQVWFAVVGHQR